MKKNGLTIGIPVYNEKDRIERAVRSAVKQCEYLIIADNASTDGTDKVCGRLSKEFSNIIYFRHHSNIGAIRNWLSIVTRTQTSYLMFLGSHDHIAPDYVERVLPALNNHDVAVAFGELEYEYGSRHVPDTEFNSWKSGEAESRLDRFEAMVYGRVPVVWATYGIFRTETVRRHLTPELAPYGIDVLFMANVLLEGKLVLVKGAHYYAWMRDSNALQSTNYLARLFGRQPDMGKRQLRNEFRTALHDLTIKIYAPDSTLDKFKLRLKNMIRFGCFRYPVADPMYYLVCPLAKLARRFIRLRN